jgi:hypothetical protein
MAKWIGAAILMLALMTGGLATINSAAAEPSQGAVQPRQGSRADDIGAPRRARHHHRYADRRYDPPYYPTYYDRPYYYAPAPFFPLLGLGYGPWW